MAINYTALRGKAAKLITDNGMAVTWTPVTASSFDAATGAATQTTGSAITAYAVVSEYDDRDVDGELIRREDKKLLLEAEAFADASVTPSEDDRVTVSSRVYRVVRLMPLSPAGTAVTYEAQVRAT